MININIKLLNLTLAPFTFYSSAEFQWQSNQNSPLLEWTYLCQMVNHCSWIKLRVVPNITPCIPHTRDLSIGFIWFKRVSLFKQRLQPLISYDSATRRQSRNFLTFFLLTHRGNETVYWTPIGLRASPDDRLSFCLIPVGFPGGGLDWFFCKAELCILVVKLKF